MRKIALLFACAFPLLASLRPAKLESCALYYAAGSLGHPYWCYGGCESSQDCATLHNDTPQLVGIYCECDGVATSACTAEVIFWKATGAYAEFCVNRGCAHPTVCSKTDSGPNDPNRGEGPFKICDCRLPPVN
jgi:hypothetical protein